MTTLPVNHQNQILLGDSRKTLRDLPEGCVDLVVTSPPYKDSDGYSSDLISDVMFGCYDALKSGGLLFLNFGHLAEDKARPFNVMQIAIGQGFRLAETFTWVKNHFRPLRGDKRVNNLTEFVFMFYKDVMPALDRLSIGVPYVDKSNIKRFYGEGKADVRCRGNIWYIPYETVQKKAEKLHNDRFPVALAEMCIKLSAIPKGSLVLDPFLGSGTTAVAAKKLDMTYLGFDINPNWVEVATNRLVTS